MSFRDDTRTIVEWLNEHNELNREELTLRILEIGEEFGEASQAWIGHVGQNPRKSLFTQTPLQEVINELADVVITALVAIESMEGIDAIGTVEARMKMILWRITRSSIEGDDNERRP